eukprot:jgi/Ulvmu1/8923/UM005_0014.1
MRSPHPSEYIHHKPVCCQSLEASVACRSGGACVAAFIDIAAEQTKSDSEAQQVHNSVPRRYIRVDSTICTYVVIIYRGSFRVFLENWDRTPAVVWWQARPLRGALPVHAVCSTICFLCSIISHVGGECRDFVEGIKKLGKSIQGGLPIVGLISRLTAPEGGFDELTYPEFCRTQLEAGSNRLNFAIADLEAAHGQQAGRRAVLLYAWMIKQGIQVLPDEFFVLSARRLNASMDVEAEMNRFEQALEVERRQYLEPTVPDPEREVAVAIDALATCCLGLKDPQAIGDSDKTLILDILAVLFDNVDEDKIKGLMDNKASRAYVG